MGIGELGTNYMGSIATDSERHRLWREAKYFYLCCSQSWSNVMMIGDKELKIKINEQRLSMMILRNTGCDLLWNKLYFNDLWCCPKTSTFPEYRFDRLIMPTWRINIFYFLEALLRCYHCHSERQCLSMLWLFPGVGRGRESGGQWLWFVLSRRKIGTMGGRLNPPCCSLITSSHYMALVTMTIWW